MKKYMVLLADIAYGIAAAASACAIVMAVIFTFFEFTPLLRGLFKLMPVESKLFVGLDVGGEVLPAFFCIMFWLVPIFVWCFLARWVPRLAYFMKVTSVLGLLLLPLFEYLFAWHLFGLRSGGLSYGSIPVARTHVVWLFMLPAMTLLCIAWGIQSRDRAITHGGVFALGAGVIVTLLGVWLR
jgi:hypothetical protein